MATEHPLDDLETTERSLHRAHTEEFAFRLHDGDVIVRNCTYEQPAEHEYRITIDEGVPVDCTCPAEEYYTPACKHRVAVAIRDAVLGSAVRMQVATDGGAAPAQAEHASPGDDAAEGAERPDDCDCEALSAEFPCWPCFRDGNATFDD